MERNIPDGFCQETRYYDLWFCAILWCRVQGKHPLGPSRSISVGARLRTHGDGSKYSNLVPRTLFPGAPHLLSQAKAPWGRDCKYSGLKTGILCSNLSRLTKPARFTMYVSDLYRPEPFYFVAPQKTIRNPTSVDHYCAFISFGKNGRQQCCQKFLNSNSKLVGACLSG